MPDPSADRPPTPPEQLFSEADVALVDETIDAWFSDMMLDCWPNFEPAARLVLTALASAGRLLPVDAEHDEEFAVVGALPDGTPWASDPHYRLGDARQLAAMMAPGAVIKRRLINAGPWVEVDGSPPKRFCQPCETAIGQQWSSVSPLAPRVAQMAQEWHQRCTGCSCTHRTDTDERQLDGSPDA